MKGARAVNLEPLVILLERSSIAGRGAAASYRFTVARKVGYRLHSRSAFGSTTTPVAGSLSNRRSAS